MPTILHSILSKDLMCSVHDNQGLPHGSKYGIIISDYNLGKPLLQLKKVRDSVTLKDHLLVQYQSNTAEISNWSC